MPYDGLDTLKSLDRNTGKPPETRMENAEATQSMVIRLINNDQKRSRKRSKVAGLIDGNPPYVPSKLRDAGRADACNVNFGTARSYTESADGAFYDLFSQAPGFVTVTTSHGDTDQEKIDNSRIMSQEADRLMREDEEWDNDMQLSQQQTVLNGNGPLYFEDAYQVFPMAIETGNLLVPERTPSKLKRWELATILWDYYPPELYEFIRNEKAATMGGWDVEYSQSVIMNAMNIRTPNQLSYNWEWYQNELKANSLAYYDDSKICRIAHVFWKEFTGRITHAMVERMDTSEEGTKYLYINVGRYDEMKNAIHPMYFDRGRGGFHHNVTGLGVKQFGPMEYENRLLCNLMDKTFAPKILFQPTSASVTAKFQLAKYGDYGLLPPGVQAVQNPIQGFLQDGIIMYRTSSDLMRSNLSQYRQPIKPDQPGNPPTKFQKQLEATQESALSGTTFNRYYKQLDTLYAEIIRRMFNPNSTDPRAIGVQKACMERGVPKECFGRITSVKAVRVIGQGNPFMRQQTTESLMGVIGGCSEEGQNNWRNDYIAAHAGQDAVQRYNPQPQQSKLSTDQRERAMNQVAGMKIGLAPTVTPSQNPMIFAGVFLQSAIGSLQSLQQGANPVEVSQYLDIVGQAIFVHLQRMASDPLKRPIYKQMLDQWKRIAAVADKLKQQLQKQAQAQREQQAKTADVMTDVQLKQTKTMHDLRLKEAKTRASLAEKAVRTKQDLSIADAKAASEIQIATAKAEAEARNKAKKKSEE